MDVFACPLERPRLPWVVPGVACGGGGNYPWEESWVQKVLSPTVHRFGGVVGQRNGVTSGRTRGYGSWECNIGASTGNWTRSRWPAVNWSCRELNS